MKAVSKGNILATGLLASIPALAHAQTTDDASAANQGDIIVTAQKREQRLTEVPLSIISQSAEQLKAAGVVTTKDLTKVVPGLVYTQNEAFAQPAIRGVSTTLTTAGAENPVAMYLDGVYVPSQNGVLFDLPDVDRIEVLKGPQGTLFGRNATAGAVQIFTRKPTFETHGRFTLSDGFFTGGSAKTANEVNVNGFVSTGLSNTLAGSLSAFYRYNQGFMTNDVNNTRSGMQRSYGVRGKLLWQPNDDVEVLLSGYYSDLLDYQSYNRAPYRGVTIAATFPDVIIPREPWHVSTRPSKPNYLKLETYGASLRADFHTGAGMLSSISGFSRSKNNDFVDASGAFSPTCQAFFACNLFEINYNSKAISQELTFVSNQFGMFQVTAGLFYYHNLGATGDAYLFGGPTADTNVFWQKQKVKSKAYAAYAEVDANPIDPLHIILGGRYSNEKLTAETSFMAGGTVFPVATPSLKNSDFTPRASVRWEFDRNTNVYATYSEGFKTGVLPAPTQNPQLPVKPEQLKSIEVGFKTVQGSLSVNAAYFHYDYTNLQLTKFVGTLSFPQNAGKAKMDGFDVDASFRASNDLTLTTAFNYMPTAKFVKYQGAPFFSLPANACHCDAPPVTNSNGNAAGFRMIRAPKFTGTAMLNWEHDYTFGKVGMNASVYHSSNFKFDVAGSVKQRGYEDVSGQLYYKVNGLRVALFGKNLLNRAVIVGSQPSSSILPLLYGAPRQIGVSLDYEF